MADVNRGNRPLSPHLMIYRPQLTSISSIMVRITGIALLGTAFLIVWWFIAAATSPEYFAVVNGLLTSWFGDLIMALSTWAIFYHILGRIRHVIWDLGYAIEIETAEKMAIGMFALATILALITFVAV
ncbi:MAG: succinate dehydrogenase, cytochrome b556 subunit [Litoreibacter sp.]|nr:succinate dehydrogenase, cytochrome b556 subunit [Litoreibacter sp.]